MMDYFDLHCDTLTELYDRRQTLSNTDCHISSAVFGKFDRFGQVFAVFSKQGLTDDECYDRFFSSVDEFETKNDISFCLTSDDIDKGGCNYILSVEDGRLTSGDPQKVERLFERGVRIMTPLWRGLTCIGGSYDTAEGLSAYGKAIVEQCISLGIITDISHASERSADEILFLGETFGKPVIASHSDSYSVCPHPRNITDLRAKRVAETGGIIGICLHAPHLGPGKADCETVFEHIDRLISVTDEDHVCIGADFDGTDKLPSGIVSQNDIYKIANVMSRHNYTEKTVHKVLYDNAYVFFKKNLPKRRTEK